MYRGPAYIFIPERIEGEVLTKWRCINPLPLPLPLYSFARHRAVGLCAPGVEMCESAGMIFVYPFPPIPVTPFPFLFPALGNLKTTVQFPFISEK